MRTVQSDLAFGLASETRHKPVLEEFLGCALERPAGSFSSYDFHNDEFVVELKTRTVRSGAYPTTMLPQRKLDRLCRDPRRVFLAFCFTDGLFCVELTSESLRGFEQNRPGGRRDRIGGSKEWKSNGYCYIPVSLLEKIGEPEAPRFERAGHP